MSQDYQTKGYSQYGASMGRSGELLDVEGTLTLRHVALTDGYDHGGAYWGDPDNLYMVTDSEGGVAYHRGNTFSVRALYPLATWAPVIEGPTSEDINEMLEAYIDAALWSSTTEEEQPMDSEYNFDDLGEGVREAMLADCTKFAHENAATVLACFGEGRCSWSQAGHDFWLTRNGHGCGFWDGDWRKAEGEKLTAACKKFGEVNLYIGDDGKVYES